jgi:hypothetical protein
MKNSNISMKHAIVEYYILTLQKYYVGNKGFIKIDRGG